MEKLKVKIRKTGKVITVSDYGEKVHPRYWDKTKGYEANEFTRVGLDKHTVERLEVAIAGLEDFPLTELQQSLVNYLRANLDDIAEALGITP